MERKRYNGWANYATWRINLEIIDDAARGGFNFDGADSVKEYVEDLLESNSSLALDYALAFISNCDWRELYEHAKENMRFETPWDGHQGSLTDLASDCDDTWAEEDIDYILERNEDFDLLDEKTVKQIQEILKQVKK